MRVRVIFIMNFLLLAIYLCATVLITYENPTALLPAYMDGGKNTIAFIPTLFTVYATWIPITKIFEKSGISRKVGKLLTPINKRLFPNENNNAYSHLSLNLSANLLGMGGAATPSGLDAMKSMTNKKNRIMLVVLNSTSLQLIPTTVIGLRANAGGIKDVILPSLIATVLTTIIAVVLVKVFVKS